MPRRKQETFSFSETDRLKATVLELERVLDDRRLRGTRRYTFSEMYALVPTFENARHRSEHSRQLTIDELMTLCDYLDCSVAERNRVLHQARYEPVLRYISGNELHTALHTATTVLSYLPAPAYVLTQDWHVHAWNSHILRLLGWTESFTRLLKAEGRLGILHFIFDPGLGVRPYLAGEDGTWEEMAYRNVYAFKTQNWLYSHDPWYLEELERLMKLPDFAYYFNLAQVDAAHPNHKTEFISQIGYPDGRTFRFRSLFISNGSIYYPQVAMYMPVDEASRAILRSLGIPVLDEVK